MFVFNSMKLMKMLEGSNLNEHVSPFMYFYHCPPWPCRYSYPDLPSVQVRRNGKNRSAASFNYILVGRIADNHWGKKHLLRTKVFRKTNISYLLIPTRTYAYQGVRNISFRKTLSTY